MLEKDAEQIVKSRGISTPEELDLAAIAFTLGVTVKESPLVGCEARIIGAGERAIVTVNSKSNLERKRFSLGHELGHWQLHRGRSFLCLPQDIGNPQDKTKRLERQADSFSADLLMPWFLFRPIAASYPHANFKTVSEVAARFKTSLTATSLRLIDSNSFPALLVCHDHHGRQWFKSSRDVPSRWFPRDRVEPESTAFSLLYGKGSKPSSPAKVDATAWFDRPEAENFEVIEHTIRISEGKVLCIIELFDEEMLEDQAATRSYPAFRTW